MTASIFTLLSSENIAKNHADALRIASNALTALTLSVERVHTDDLDAQSVNGFRSLFHAVTGTLNEVERQMRIASSEPYINWDGIQPVTPQQCADGRKLLGWSLCDLREKIGGILQIKSISNFESGKSLILPTGRGAKTIRLVFQNSGIEFMSDGSVSLRSNASRGE